MCRAGPGDAASAPRRGCHPGSERLRPGCGRAPAGSAGAAAGLGSRHAHRGPRTAGGHEERLRPRRRAGAARTHAPGRSWRRRLPRRSPRAGWSRRWTWTASRPCASTVRRLRGALEPGLPERSSGQYVLHRGAGYALAVARADVDASRFTDLAAHGSAQLAAGDAADAVRLLGTALALWRGDPYGDWPDAPFARAERRRLTAIRAAAESDLVRARELLARRPATPRQAPRPRRAKPRGPRRPRRSSSSRNRRRRRPHRDPAHPPRTARSRTRRPRWRTAAGTAAVDAARGPRRGGRGRDSSPPGCRRGPTPAPSRRPPSPRRTSWPRCRPGSPGSTSRCCWRPRPSGWRTHPRPGEG